LSLAENITEKLKKSAAAILQELRAKNRLSQMELSEISGVGRTTITHLENAARLPSMDTIFMLAAAFDLRPHELILLIEEEFSRKKSTARFRRSEAGSGNRLEG
jgi:transcriptional regulator with XRE-family HTH domain